MLQQVMPLLAQVAGAAHKLEVDKVTVLPGTPVAGDGFARAAISANEQIKAATGVDLAAAAKQAGPTSRDSRRAGYCRRVSADGP